MNNSKDLIKFINDSPSMYHSIETIEKYLKENNFTYLKEEDKWKISKGKNYYTKRNNSSIIAFKVGSKLNNYHYQIVSSHCDSPTFKLKHVSEIVDANGYLKLDVEGYGGMINYTWLDKPLSLAGRVLVKKGNKLESRLLYVDEDLFIIPSLAIHQNREVNKNLCLNPQVDMLPMVSCGDLKKGDFNKFIADKLKVKVNEIVGKDLYLVNRQEGKIWGINKEFISSPKLDDLACAFTSLKGFLASSNSKHINMYVCFDNEEVGSNTKQGARSTFMKDTIKRINSALNKDSDELYRAIAKSFMVSADNGHAIHPNHPEKYDAVNACFLNKGVVIKEHAQQQYATDAFSRATLSSLLDLKKVPYQTFANRSDMQGGSTLGNISNSQVSMHCVDVGLPQLAMHSNYETMGSKDVDNGINTFKVFYNCDIDITSDGVNFNEKD